MWVSNPLWNAVDIAKHVEAKPQTILKTLRLFVSEENLGQRSIDRSNARFGRDVKNFADVVVAEFYSEELLPAYEVAFKHSIKFDVVTKIWDDHFTSKEQSTRMVDAKDLAMANHKALTKGEQDRLRDKTTFTKDSNGYYLMPKPFWVTGREGSTHIFVHQIVIMEALGITAIPSGFVVHHINENIHDNELTNLALLTMAAHRRQHKMTRK